MFFFSYLFLLHYSLTTETFHLWFGLILSKSPLALPRYCIHMFTHALRNTCSLIYTHLLLYSYPHLCLYILLFPYTLTPHTSLKLTRLHPHAYMLSPRPSPDLDPLTYTPTRKSPDTYIQTFTICSHLHLTPPSPHIQPHT